MHRRRSLTLAISTAALVALAPTAAFAAPPTNDDFDSATVITGIGFTDSISTVEATTSPDDPNCEGNGPTVWYAFTPATDQRIEVNTFGSSYDTTLSMYTGSRGALTQIACNDDAGFDVQSRLRFDAVSGQTFYFMVGSFASESGGDLVLSVLEAPAALPALELDVTLNPDGAVNAKTGVATVSGTVTCSRPEFIEIYGELRQRAGRVYIDGYFFDYVECDGVTPWTATIEYASGRFAAGSAEGWVEAFWCDWEDDDGNCSFDYDERTVKLKGGGRSR